jgi:hypothetical protein
MDELQEWSAQALFTVVKARCNNYIKDFGPSRVDIACMRGPIRPTKSVGVRSTSTRKRGCTWEATAKALSCNGRRWTLEIRSGHEHHNHPAEERAEYTPLIPNFNSEQYAFISTYAARPSIPTREIAKDLRAKFPGIVFTTRRLNNARFRASLDALDGYTPVQATLRMFHERGYHHAVLPSRDNPYKPEGLFWTLPWGEEQWRLYPWVQMYDNTYKTNNKNLAFFQVVSLNQYGKTFNCAFGLINNERQEGFDWLMDQVNARRIEIGANPPRITITDFDHAMRNAVARVYPEAQRQLCIFHINKNMVSHVKRKWDKRAAAQVAQNEDNEESDDDHEDHKMVVKRLNRMVT